MTEKQLITLGTKWQKRLRLQDWEIKFELTDKLESVSAFGESSAAPPFMEALVRVRSGMLPKDTELTLIHELLHVRFPNHSVAFTNIFDRSEIIGAEFEIGIEMVSRALYTAYNEE